MISVWVGVLIAAALPSGRASMVFPPTDTTRLASAPRAVRYARRVDSEKVGLALDPADLPLAGVQCSGQLDLRAPGGAAYLGEVNHDSILH